MNLSKKTKGFLLILFDVLQESETGAKAMEQLARQMPRLERDYAIEKLEADREKHQARAQQCFDELMELRKPPRAVCSYCDAVYRDGPEPVSHGICEDCLPAVQAEIEKMKAAKVAKKKRATTKPETNADA